MNLGIKPVHYDFLNCSEDSIVAVAEWANYRYELIFSEDWYFVFNENLNQRLGELLKVFNDDIEIKLEKYHGIKILSGKVSPAEIIEIIKFELEKKRPVMVSMDSYLCPWDWNYQKMHHDHWLLVIGMEGREIFHCCDGFFNTCGNLTKEELMEGLFGIYKIFRFNDNEKIYVNWGEILKNTVKKLNDGNGSKNAFDSMRNFADTLGGLTDIQDEIQGYVDNLFEAPLIKKLEYITYNRRRFAKLLEYFEEETELKAFNELSVELTKAASQWANVRAMLIKIAFSKDTSIKKRAMNKIQEIANLEEGIASHISQIYISSTNSSGVFSNRYLKSSKFKRENIDAYNKKFLFIDLTSYLNNKAFGDSISLECPANLMGTGTYFLKENFSSKGNYTWTIKEMEFKLPWLYDTGKDNVACNGQKIPIPNEVCQNLMILGCAEWGSFNDTLFVYHMDNQIEKISIKLTDCLYKPLYGEIIAWEGRAVEKIDDHVQLRGGKVYIVAQKYEITLKSGISFLQLPDCPSIHIFAISLA